MPIAGYIQKIAKDGKTDDTLPLGTTMPYSGSPNDLPAGWRWFARRGPLPPPRRWPTEEERPAKKEEEIANLERLVAEATRDAIIAAKKGGIT